MAYDYYGNEYRYDENPEENGGKRPPRERSEYSAIFWENVERILRVRMMKWEQLSYIMGTSRTNIASMKSRQSRLTIDTVVKVADALRVPLPVLLNFEPDRYQYNGILLSEDEYRLLSEYLRIKNINRESATKAFNIIMNVLEQFGKPSDVRL